MYNGLLHLHNLLRWVILLLLLISIFQAFSKSRGLTRTSLFLVISAHLTFVLGVYQWITSPTVGLSILKRMDYNFGAVMKDAFARFWVVEHFAGMLIAIVLITIGRAKAKRLKHMPAAWLFLIALLIILAVVPWPFRPGIGRPWFPGM
ncbi:MAG: hypothetical protein ABIX01_13550 [Chitinophagaceae bacterium]